MTEDGPFFACNAAEEHFVGYRQPLRPANAKYFKITEYDRKPLAALMIAANF
jgi:hypothetical protein